MQKFLKANWFRVSIVAILVIACLLLLTLTISEISPKKSTAETGAEEKTKDNFDRNQKCLEQKDEVVKKLENKDSPFGKLSLEQIFYSPRQNSCLYVEYSEKFNFYNKRLLDVLNDGESSEPLEMCSSAYPTRETKDSFQENNGLKSYERLLKACENFDQKISGYKS